VCARIAKRAAAVGAHLKEGFEVRGGGCCLWGEGGEELIEGDAGGHGNARGHGERCWKQRASHAPAQAC
jgi:hypothetical protein